MLHNNVYTGLLGISLGALLVACAMLFLDYRQYDGTAPSPASEILSRR
jgi:hypothetical protein